MPIEWLLSGEPFVRYRILTDLLSKSEDDSEVIATKKRIRTCVPVKNIFKKQNKDGYWGAPNDIYTWWPKKDTTFWMLGVLADFGFTRDDRNIKRASEYVFSTQHPTGGWGCAPPPKPYDCFTGILTEALAKLGYGPDRRLKKAYTWLTHRQRGDGGFWCKDTGQPGRSREREPSCAYATLCVLGALAQEPALRNSSITKKSVAFLLKCWDNRGRIKYAGHDSQIGTGWEKLKYPFTDYRILNYLDKVTQCTFAHEDSRVGTMIDLLFSKRDNSGRFHAESIHNVWSRFDFGQKELPSRWITLLAYRIIKRLGSNLDIGQVSM
jgi:hypothetical protein